MLVIILSFYEVALADICIRTNFLDNVSLVSLGDYCLFPILSIGLEVRKGAVLVGRHNNKDVL